MSRIYQNPPLVEALCEFQFVEDEWDWTIPGLIYQDIQARFPQKRQTKVVEFAMEADAAQFNQRIQRTTNRMQFVRADETAMVQVGPNLLVVNHLAPYPHWAEFKPIIFDTLSVYQNVAKPAGFNRIGLRYINRIVIPGTDFDFATYFTVQPCLPDTIDVPFRSLFLRLELPYADNNGSLLLTLASTPSESPEMASFILDFDFVTTDASELTVDTARIWVEQAHNRIEEAFEACITDDLRKLFKEVTP